MTDHQCQNGVDYDECDERVSKNGALCDNCNEAAYDQYMENLMSGEPPLTLKEQQAIAWKQKHGL
jgi:hypothetical protein